MNYENNGYLLYVEHARARAKTGAQNIVHWPNGRHFCDDIGVLKLSIFLLENLISRPIFKNLLKFFACGPKFYRKLQSV